jgi:RNA polymerase sigma-70 factor (ECF subfamily)
VLDRGILKVRVTPRHPASVEVVAAESAHGPPLDEELVRAARAGDAAAFRALYEANFDFVFRTCRRLGLPDADAEDATQETFVVASRRLGDFESGKLSTWLYRIAANLVSARHRKRRLREALFSLWGRGDDEVAPSPHGVVEARQAAARVGAVLARMSPKKREVFALYELEGLSGEQIAERVGCKIDTVWTRLWHARKEFEAIARKRGLYEEEER